MEIWVSEETVRPKSLFEEECFGRRVSVMVFLLDMWAIPRTAAEKSTCRRMKWAHRKEILLDHWIKETMRVSFWRSEQPSRVEADCCLPRVFCSSAHLFMYLLKYCNSVWANYQSAAWWYSSIIQCIRKRHICFLKIFHTSFQKLPISNIFSKAFSILFYFYLQCQEMGNFLRIQMILIRQFLLMVYWMSNFIYDAGCFKKMDWISKQKHFQIWSIFFKHPVFLLKKNQTLTHVSH